MGKFETEYRRLNDAQRAAVDAIEGPVMVLAGPGTGKTQLLSMRVANILRRTDVSPKNILCLTFTESGQQAMQQRLMELIGSEAGNIPVHTFHGFGTAIIASNPESFFEAEHFRPADDLRLFEIYYEIFERLPHRNPLSQRAYGEFIYLKDTQERVSQCKAAGLTPETLRQLIEFDTAWCKRAEPLIASVLPVGSRIGKAERANYQQLLKRLVNMPTVTAPFSWWQPLGSLCTQELAAAIESLGETGKTAALTAWKKTWLETRSNQTRLKASRQYERLTALVDVYTEYLQGLRNRHLFDYDDMILEVLQALDTQPELLATLQEQYQYILVDEYQDTNGAQATLIEKLADNPVNEGRPNLMIVGDDDQAIYGFQGAQAGIMLLFRERWRNVTTITLGNNYRSHQAILDAIRSLITQGQERLENYYDDINKTLQAVQQTTSPAPRLIRAHEEAQQYAWLVEEVQRLIAKGIPANEVAIIAPRHKYLLRLLPYFQATSIPVVYERRQNILEQTELRQLLHLAEVCVLLSDNALGAAEKLLPELLSYPFWGIPTKAIWELSITAKQHQQTWPQALEATSQPQLSKTWHWINDGREYVTQSIDESLPLLRNVIEAGRPNAELRSALDVLRYHVRTYLPDTTVTLRELVRYARLCRQAGIYLRDIPDSSIVPNGVQIMTAHKAKGLEFSAVFVLNAHETVWASERGQRNKLGLPANLPIQPPGESRDDRLRLLYVASSRAKQHLIFTSYENDSNGKPVQPLVWLEKAEPLNASRPKLQEPAPPTAPHNNTYDWRDCHWQALQNPKAKKLLKQRLTSYCLSPTHLVSFLDITHGGPKQFLTDHLLAFPRALPLDAIFGQLMHATLDTTVKMAQAHKTVPDLQTVLDDFDRRLDDASLIQTDQVRLRQRGHDALTLFVKEQGNSFLIPQASEQTFTTPTDPNQPRLTGRIDRLLQDNEGMVIIDLKTGKSFSTWQGKTDYDKLKLHTFQLQLVFYKLLVERCNPKDLGTKEGQIVFLEADSEGNLNRLTQSYEQATVERSTQLIKAVWQSITNLSLPETNHYEAGYSGVIAFEDDLLA